MTFGKTVNTNKTQQTCRGVLFNAYLHEAIDLGKTHHVSFMKKLILGRNLRASKHLAQPLTV